MQYVIMKRVTLEAYQKGYSEELQALFYQFRWYDDKGHERHKWTKCLGDSRTWPSEQEAWDYVLKLWGMKFSYTNFLVIAVHQEALDHSLRDRDKIVHGKEAL